MTLKEETISKIETLVNEFFDTAIFIETRNIEDAKKAYPFHAVFFTEEAFVAALNERSIVTKMGQTFYPQLAEILVRNQFNSVWREHDIMGEIDEGVLEKINIILAELRGKRKTESGIRRRPHHETEMSEILSASTGRKKVVNVTADLYVEDFNTGPLFLEIKSPLPNIDVCMESKLKILQFKAMLADKNPRAYLAFPYNPFIERHKYRHSFTKQIMDMEKEVLLGKEMWDLIGGEGAYEETLKIINQVSDKKWRERRIE
jgi:hypothetical protein